MSVVLSLVFTWNTTLSQSNNNEPLTRILFIYDASNSMNGRWQSNSKNTIARKLLSNALDSLQSITNLELAFRAYGHQKHFPPQDCDDTQLIVPFKKNNISAIKTALNRLKPKGTTPIAASLEEAGNDFPNCSDCRNIIIMITDGIEECNGDPCAVSLMLRRKGIILKPFVIGVGLDMEFKKTFECVGNYYDATNETTFKNVLNIVISQALNSTTTQVNLLDIGGQPNETNVNMTFYDHFSGRIYENYYHTINNRGNPDTIKLDPAPTYDMTVHSIPPVSVDSIVITPGIHNIIAADVPQGTLNLVEPLGSNYDNLVAIIRKSGDMNTLHTQTFGQNEKYLVGKYDLEILSLPRILLNDVVISQSHTTKIEIPAPGIATIMNSTTGYGSLYLEKNNELELIYTLPENTTRQSLTLQPGNYRIVFRSKGAKESIFTKEKSFSVRSGASSVVKLF